MLFNSIEFLIFLPVVFSGYWVLRDNLRFQNLWIVVASYLFYGWWDWRFLALIAFTSAWSYAVGLLELRRWHERPSRMLLAASLIVNLGILWYFKYCNFFLDALGLSELSSLKIILPVGISFYTFQALSYTIDVYRRNILPTRDPIAFFAFISFFPQLVAGPIERATNLLPQFLAEKRFDYSAAVMGCRQMLWGFFKKVVVADNCAAVADQLLNGPSQGNGLAVVLGVLCFTLQIYGDFSGYSDIAIGCSRLFGVKLMCNFRYPYFSRDIAEFWRRWHVSLTTWFRDYLYIPLGGSRCSRGKVVRNTFVIFLVSGLWHGANWTFVAWGAFHAMLFLPLIARGRNRRFLGPVAEGRHLPAGRELLMMVRTFLLVLFGWSLFRAQSLGQWWQWLRSVCDVTSYAAVEILADGAASLAVTVPVLLCVEWLGRTRGFALESMPGSRILRVLVYYGLLVAIVFFQAPGQQFIYFQF